MITKTTSNQNYPKPDENNSLQDDVRNIENALDMIDQDVNALNRAISDSAMTILSAGGVKAAAATLSNSNQWGNFPDLTITFTIPVATSVIISYHISMPGSGSHLCTRLMVDATELVRELTGDIGYWGISPSCAIKLAGGSHTVKVQYRTPAGGVNNPAGSDYQSRFLQVMIMGQAT